MAQRGDGSLSSMLARSVRNGFDRERPARGSAVPAVPSVPDFASNPALFSPPAARGPSEGLHPSSRGNSLYETAHSNAAPAASQPSLHTLFVSSTPSFSTLQARAPSPPSPLMHGNCTSAELLDPHMPTNRPPSNHSTAPQPLGAHPLTFQPVWSHAPDPTHQTTCGQPSTMQPVAHAPDTTHQPPGAQPVTIQPTAYAPDLFQPYDTLSMMRARSQALMRRALPSAVRPPLLVSQVSQS